MSGAGRPKRQHTLADRIAADLLVGVVVCVCLLVPVAVIALLLRLIAWAVAG